ncbi:ABC transporter ATP-binding protein [Granulosicoccus antarcticus]|uniref:Oligopeptide transport ATP-binding protein OppF n=1 Tax=Granulosicoccus antarcticus IMCC3135 TaxID=1192854 RepID=A0A2Z2NT54_9GAMM|nr:dipeptide ABC transporter ATP-binding protein [Granulosicoccus antarcticus]ASJ70294.1 Oligopeptide transport ATP-binding protein OppF [Granulosicoccus antarcticus IMCC3135]
MSDSVNNLLIEAQGLSRFYEVSNGFFGGNATVKALSNVSFTLEAGRTLAVVGESGCGKSTLARVVTMIETPTAGELTLDGHHIRSDVPLTEQQQAELRASVQIVFQDPFGSLNPRQTIGRILEEPVLINRRDVTKAQREQQAREMLKMVGLRPEHYDRYPHMFSGGQRQRIAVARALMLEPRILVLDEPVSALDLSIQSQILNLLVELQERLNLAYLFISHDLSVVRHMADDVMVMYLGRVVERGSAAEVFESPRHPYTRALLSATPVADPTHVQTRIRLEGELPSPLNPPAGCAFNPRCWKAEDKCRQSAPELTEGEAHAVACYFPL